MNTTVNPIETLAISKLVKDAKAARKLVAPGEYDTDFWLHVTGSMDVADNYTRRVPQKAKPWSLVAVALSHLNGVTVESIVREALDADEAHVADIKAKADGAVRAIKGTTETVCAGRVKTDLAVELVHAAVAANAA